MRIAAALFAFTASALPAPVNAAQGATGFRAVQSIRAGGSLLQVQGTTAFDDPSSCNGSASNLIVVIQSATASYSEIMALLMSASAMGKQVQFWVNGCVTENGNQYPNATYIYLTP